jgi:hypothetical protein
MGRLLEIVTPLRKATKCDFLARMNDDKTHGGGEGIRVRLLGQRRRYGYVGYKFIEGRWKPLAQGLIDLYGLKDGSSVLDVGCGKGVPALRDEENSAGPQDRRLRHFNARSRLSPREIKSYLFHYRARDPRRWRVRPGDFAGPPAQSAPTRAGDRGAGDQPGRQGQVHHGRDLGPACNGGEERRKREISRNVSIWGICASATITAATPRRICTGTMRVADSLESEADR